MKRQPSTCATKSSTKSAPARLAREREREEGERKVGRGVEGGREKAKSDEGRGR